MGGADAIAIARRAISDQCKLTFFKVGAKTIAAPFDRKEDGSASSIEVQGFADAWNKLGEFLKSTGQFD